MLATKETRAQHVRLLRTVADLTEQYGLSIANVDNTEVHIHADSESEVRAWKRVLGREAWSKGGVHSTHWITRENCGALHGATVTIYLTYKKG